MGIARDLLAQAHHLAEYGGENPTQAALRRSVSTAYHALFHLLVADAARLCLSGDASPEARPGVERAFQHGSMKIASLKFNGPVWQDWHGLVRPMPPALRRVAAAFAELQEERHTADYNNHEQWRSIEVQTLLSMTGGAFQDWESIRADPMAGNYLLAMLLPRQRC